MSACVYHRSLLCLSISLWLSSKGQWDNIYVGNKPKLGINPPPYPSPSLPFSNSSFLHFASSLRLLLISPSLPLPLLLHVALCRCFTARWLTTWLPLHPLKACETSWLPKNTRGSTRTTQEFLNVAKSKYERDSIFYLATGLTPRGAMGISSL